MSQLEWTAMPSTIGPGVAMIFALAIAARFVFAPSINDDRTSVAFKTAETGGQQPSEQRNAQIALRSFSDAYLRGIRSEMLSFGAAPEAVDAAVTLYQGRREDAVQQVASLWRADPGVAMQLEQIRSHQQQWPRGEPWDPNAAEETRLASRRLEETANEASQTSGVPGALLNVGKSHSAAVLAFADATSDIVTIAGHADSAKRLRWLVLTAYIDADDPLQAPSQAFLTEIGVLQLWEKCRPKAGDGNDANCVLSVDEFGLPRSGDAAVLLAVDHMLESSAAEALVMLRTGGPVRNVSEAILRLRKSCARRWESENAVLDALVRAARDHGLHDAAEQLQAEALRALSPTVDQRTWLEIDASTCLEALHAAGAVEDSGFAHLSAWLTEACRQLRECRDRTVAAGLKSRRAFASKGGDERRDALVRNMLAFDRMVLTHKRELASLLPADWEKSLDPDLKPRSAGFGRAESCLDLIAKRALANVPHSPP